MTTRREEVGHDHDLVCPGGDAGVDRVGDAGPEQRQVSHRDASSVEAAPQRRGDARELSVGGAFPTAVVDEDHRGGPLASPHSRYQ